MMLSCKFPKVSSMRCLVAIATYFLISATAIAGPGKEFRDTGVYCTNGLTCDLTLAPKGTPKEIFSIVLSRKSGPDTPVLIKIRTNKPVKPGSDVVFLADGAEAARIAAADFDYDPDFYEYTAKDLGRGKALLSLLRDSSLLTIKAELDAAQSADFSLSGVAAAMLYLDEVQGRIGTVDALHKIGDKPGPPVMVRDITDVTDLPAAIRPEFESSESTCGFMDMNRFRYGQGFAAMLSGDAELFALPCAEGGAYNQPYVFYQKQGDTITPLQLAIMTDDGPSTTPMAYNIDWDQNTRMLTAFFKGRGIGDCGSLDKWVLRNIDGEVSFALKESRFKDDCDGIAEPGPDGWPLIWPKG
jgi:Protein of unknown function (DUF1176)